jgi:hypothetical protein
MRGEKQGGNVFMSSLAPQRLKLYPSVQLESDLWKLLLDFGHDGSHLWN